MLLKFLESKLPIPSSITKNGGLGAANSKILPVGLSEEDSSWPRGRPVLAGPAAALARGESPAL